MKYQLFVRAAAGALAAAAFSTVALAQVTAPTMTDTAPTPAHDRGSVGAVIMLDQPVLAQREQMQALQDRSPVDTRSMGAGPARVLRKASMKSELKERRAQDAATKPQGTPK